MMNICDARSDAQNGPTPEAGLCDEMGATLGILHVTCTWIEGGGGGGTYIS